MMRQWVATVSVLLIAGSAVAQTQKEDAEVRMARMARRSSQPTTPAAKVASTQPFKLQRIKLKPGAPDLVQKWYASIPETRARSILELRGDIEDAEDTLAQLKKQKAEMLRRPNPVKRNGVTPIGASYRSDDNASAIMAKEEKDKDREIKTQISTVAELKAKLDRATANPTFVGNPRLEPELGSWGRIVAARVFQVVGDKEFIAETVMFPEKVWIKGVDLAGVTDGKILPLEKLVFTVSGTKRYSTALGGSKTIFMAEPVDVKPYVEVEDVPGTTIP